MVSEVFFKLSRRDFSLWRETEAVLALIFMAVSLYALGNAMSSLSVPLVLTSSYVYQLVIGSGFLLYAVAGRSVSSPPRDTSQGEGACLKVPMTPTRRPTR